MHDGLHIGVDASELAGTPTGVGRYVAGVLQEWSQTGLPHRVTLFLHRDPPAWVRSLGFTCEVVIAPAAGSGTWWEQRTLPGQDGGREAMRAGQPGAAHQGEPQQGMLGAGRRE